MKKLVLILSSFVLASLLFIPCLAAPADAPEIKAIKNRGVLKVGVKVDVPNFGYRDPKTGKIDGFEIELARILAKEILGD